MTSVSITFSVNFTSPERECIGLPCSNRKRMGPQCTARSALGTLGIGPRQCCRWARRASVHGASVRGRRGMRPAGWVSRSCYATASRSDGTSLTAQRATVLHCTALHPTHATPRHA
eukprot:gene3479-biopygen429